MAKEPQSDKQKPDLASRVREELQHEETLIYCGYQSTFALGCVFLPMGLVFFVTGISHFISRIMGDGYAPVDLGMGVLIAIGVFHMTLGILPFRSMKNYYFVTERRICHRGKGWFKKTIDRDYPLASITEIYEHTEKPRNVRRGGMPVANIKTIRIKMEGDKKTYILYPNNAKEMYEAIEETRKKMQI